MRLGKMLKPGDVVLAQVQFTDTFEVKKRPAVILFEDMGNVIVAGITSNLDMKGIPITKKEGAITDSVIKTNYIFTISTAMMVKPLFQLTKEKRQAVFKELVKQFDGLNR